VKKTLFFIFTSFSVLFLHSNAISRDINLDAIYLRETSPNYNRLLEAKLTAYETVNSQFIARDVIFALWQDGYNIMYIKEFPDINVLYSYNRITRIHGEICRIQGAIVAATGLINGAYVYLKRLRMVEGMVVRGETLAVDLKTKKISMLEPSSPFIDFSLTPEGRGILYETKPGIVEYCTETKVKNLIMKKSAYADIVRSGYPTIACLSPNRKKMVLVNGSGGTYRAKIFAFGIPRRLIGISSSSELFWINNNQFVYRKGFAGNYSVHVYDASAHRSWVLDRDSLNTNIRFSNLAKMVSFLHDQLIQIYDMRRNQIIRTGLEGEDVLFSPDGSRFISIFLKRLFITNVYFVQKKFTEIAGVSKQIIRLYKIFHDSQGDWTNDFSQEYLRRKISVYNRFWN
jgi:hypothetical protein